MANTMRHINIIGHQNPDTDSICSALAYAWLKNRGSLTGLYEARRAGHVNRETKFVLQHFGVEPPRLCTDVSPQIKDIDIRKQAGIDGEMSLRAAWNLMRDVEIDTLCIVDDENELQGLITIKDIEKAVQYPNSARDEKGRLLVGAAIGATDDVLDRVAALVEALKKDGHDFTVGIPMDTPINQAERVVSAGKGIGDKKNMKLIENLAKAAGAAVGSSRPVAETLKYVPLSRYVGMSGQKFTGNLYIACGISGATQHLKGIKDASTIVAINKNGNAPIFKNCDYGIVGDVNEILPLLAAALDTGEKQPAPPMVKMKRPPAPKPEPIGKRYVCGGCGYEYIPELGDEDAEIAPGTLFENLPEDWVCPLCQEGKEVFEPID